MITRQRSVLLVGNFLSSHFETQGISETLSIKLENVQWRVFTTSSKRVRFYRIADMIYTTIRHNHKYDLVVIDVFSGYAFFMG